MIIYWNIAKELYNVFSAIMSHFVCAKHDNIHVHVILFTRSKLYVYHLNVLPLYYAGE